MLLWDTLGFYDGFMCIPGGTGFLPYLQILSDAGCQSFARPATRENTTLHDYVGPEPKKDPGNSL